MNSLDSTRKRFRLPSLLAGNVELVTTRATWYTILATKSTALKTIQTRLFNVIMYLEPSGRLYYL